jgi:hypothetical protein
MKNGCFDFGQRFLKWVSSRELDPDFSTFRMLGRICHRCRRPASELYGNLGNWITFAIEDTQTSRRRGTERF